jgi:hypothetical protein
LLFHNFVLIFAVGKASRIDGPTPKQTLRLIGPNFQANLFSKPERHQHSLPNDIVLGDSADVGVVGVEFEVGFGYFFGGFNGYLCDKRTHS